MSEQQSAQADRWLHSLRRKNPAQGMSAWQNNAAMIHFSRRGVQRIGNRIHPLHQRPAASRTPIRMNLLGQHRVALAAHSFHTERLQQQDRIPDVSSVIPDP
jgi:hypothetical protein